MKGRVKHCIRKDGKGGYKTMHLNARMAIREHCKECVGFNVNEVRRCASPNCALFPFRLQRTGKGSLAPSK